MPTGINGLCWHLTGSRNIVGHSVYFIASVYLFSGKMSYIFSRGGAYFLDSSFIPLYNKILPPKFKKLQMILFKAFIYIYFFYIFCEHVCEQFLNLEISTNKGPFCIRIAANSFLKIYIFVYIYIQLNVNCLFLINKITNSFNFLNYMYVSKITSMTPFF